MRLPNASGVYVIRHLGSGKEYVGSAAHLAYRWRRHREALRNGGHHNPHLQAAWNLYGGSAFVCEILELVSDPAALLTAEQRHLDERKPAYNILLVAGRPEGFHHTLATREKLAAATKRRMSTPEGRAWASALHKGKMVSTETRELLRRINTGKTIAPATREKISQAGRGAVRSPETRAKIGSARRGKAMSAESRAKLSASRRGMKMSPEVRAAMSQRRKGMTLHPNTRAAIAEANRNRTPEQRAAIGAKIRAKMLERLAAQRAEPPTQEPPL